MTSSKQTLGGAATPPAVNDPAVQAGDDGKRPIDITGTWRPIAGQLAALIGEGGFCALLGRAIRTLQPRYDWLGIETGRSIDASLASLQRTLASADAATAPIANRELLQIFTRQLSTLIGETLTERLLKEAGIPQTDTKMDRSTNK